MTNLEYFNKNLKNVVFKKTDIFGEVMKGFFIFGDISEYYVDIIRTSYTYYGPNKLEDFRPILYKVDTIVYQFKNTKWEIDKQETRNRQLNKIGI
jgi:hypothetical protein